MSSSMYSAQSKSAEFIIYTTRIISEYTLFYIRTSNFGAEAERSYFFGNLLNLCLKKFLRCS